MCKTYFIIQFIRLFYKFFPVENKKSGVEKFKVINKANFRKKGWKKLIHPNKLSIPFITTEIIHKLLLIYKGGFIFLTIISMLRLRSSSVLSCSLIFLSPLMTVV